MALALKQEDLQVIGEYVQSHLTEWLPEKTSEHSNFIYPIELAERMIRVEEELKNQRELMKQGFDQIDKRIELLQINMDKRFEQVDKRFEQMQHNMDKRFEQMQNYMDKRFEQMQTSMDIQHGHIEKHFSQLQWTMGLGFTILAALLGIFNFY